VRKENWLDQTLERLNEPALPVYWTEHVSYQVPACLISFPLQRYRAWPKPKG